MGVRNLETIVLELPDVLRLRCRACDRVWPAGELERCDCGSDDVAEESLNEALRSLREAEERVEALIAGIREHVALLRDEERSTVSLARRV